MYHVLVDASCIRDDADLDDKHTDQESKQTSQLVQVKGIKSQTECAIRKELESKWKWFESPPSLHEEDQNCVWVARQCQCTRLDLSPPPASASPAPLRSSQLLTTTNESTHSSFTASHFILKVTSWRAPMSHLFTTCTAKHWPPTHCSAAISCSSSSCGLS